MSRRRIWHKFRRRRASLEDDDTSRRDNGASYDDNNDYSPTVTDDSDAAEQDSIPLQKKRKLDRSKRYLEEMAKGLNLLSEVHRDSSRPPGMVSTAEGQSKEETSSESEETAEGSGKREETEGMHQR